MASRYEPEYAGSNDKINVVATWELNYWATRWGVSPDELIRAVAEVGTNVRVIQAHLGRGGQTVTSRSGKLPSAHARLRADPVI